MRGDSGGRMLESEGGGLLESGGGKEKEWGMKGGGESLLSVVSFFVS